MNVINIVNTIRDNASQEYQERVPEATRENIASVADPLITYQIFQNEFLNALVNKIALTIVRNKVAKNPLSILKKGTQPLGSDIEEIFTNMAKAEKYDPTGKDLLKRTIPDTKVIYHRLNRQDVYPITISDSQLQQAFTSWDKLGELITSIVNSMYSGDNYDEFVLTKNLLGSGIKNGYIKTVEVDELSSADKTKGLIKAIKNVSGLMQFPSTEFNSYIDVVSAGLGENEELTEKPVRTWTPKEDQILIIRSDVLTDIDIDVLANTFNLEKAEFKKITLEVDNFGDGGENCLAILCDRSLTQIYDQKLETKSFYNGNGLYWNYWLHHWQTYSLSSFANAIAFCTASESNDSENEEVVDGQ